MAVIRASHDQVRDVVCT